MSTAAANGEEPEEGGKSGEEDTNPSCAQHWLTEAARYIVLFQLLVEDGRERGEEDCGDQRRRKIQEKGDLAFTISNVGLTKAEPNSPMRRSLCRSFPNG